MGQPSAPPLRPPLLQPPAPPLPGGEISAVPCQVRCAGCRLILSVAPGVTEFVCPACKLPQMLPPELTSGFQFPTNPNPNSNPNPNPTSNPKPNPNPIADQNRGIGPGQSPNSSTQAHGIDPTKIQLPCANCKAILNVPYGLARFKCPQCSVDLAVDVSKIKELFPRPPVPAEEVNEVAVDVEREEDEGGLAGETFTDYRPPKLSIGPPHPDPVVETSCLSAVQPPEPTYELEIRDELETSNTLSCLQIEILVYACQMVQGLVRAERLQD